MRNRFQSAIVIVALLVITACEPSHPEPLPTPESSSDNTGQPTPSPETLPVPPQETNPSETNSSQTPLSTNAAEPPAPQAEVVEDFRTGELKLETLTEGKGAAPTANARVTISYRVSLVSGQVAKEGSRAFQLGKNEAITGIERAVLQMKQGGKTRATIPSRIAYGQRGLRAADGTYLVPPGATLIVDMELTELSH